MSVESAVDGRCRFSAMYAIAGGHAPFRARRPAFTDADAIRGH